MGAAGVALALLAATSDVEPAWDRGMLLSDLASRASANDSTQAQSGAAAGRPDSVIERVSGRSSVRVPLQPL